MFRQIAGIGRECWKRRSRQDGESACVWKGSGSKGREHGIDGAAGNVSTRALIGAETLVAFEG